MSTALQALCIFAAMCGEMPLPPDRIAQEVPPALKLCLPEQGECPAAWIHPLCLPTSECNTALNKAHLVWVLFCWKHFPKSTFTQLSGWYIKYLMDPSSWPLLSHTPSGWQPWKSDGWIQPMKKSSFPTSAVASVGLVPYASGLDCKHCSYIREGLFLMSSYKWMTKSNASSHLRLDSLWHLFVSWRTTVVPGGGVCWSSQSIMLPWPTHVFVIPTNLWCSWGPRWCSICHYVSRDQHRAGAQLTHDNGGGSGGRKGIGGRKECKDKREGEGKEWMGNQMIQRNGELGNWGNPGTWVFQPLGALYYTTIFFSKSS